MRRTILAILAVLLLAPTLRAADPVQPAGASAPTRILVLPFNMTGGEGKYAWIGQAISENFQAELAKAGFALVNPANPDGPVAVGDPDKALRVAQNSRAEVVIFGSYQFLDPDLRITGQVLDVPSNQIVGVLKASGTFRQLFTIEDDLSDQARKLLIGDAAGKEVLEPRPPLAPGKEGYDTNTTAADDAGREYKLPYKEEPVAYDDDYLGVGYTTYLYPSYYRPRIYSFIGYSNYGYYYPYADCYPYFYPSYCWYRPYWGSGLFLSFNYSHFSGHRWGGWNGWSGNHWDGHWTGNHWTGNNHWDGRGPRFGDRPRTIVARNDGPAGHDFFHGAQNRYFSQPIASRTAASNRVITVDRDRTTVTDRRTGRVETTNHAGAQLTDTPRRYTRSPDQETALRASERDARPLRRADSDSRVVTADRDRVLDRSSGRSSSDTVRSRDADSPRVRETPRDTGSSRVRDVPASREPARSAPSRDSGVSRSDSSPRGGGGGGSFRSDSGGGGGSRGGGGVGSGGGTGRSDGGSFRGGGFSGSRGR